MKIVVPGIGNLDIQLGDLLAMPGTEDLELEIPRMRDLPRPAELA